MGFPLILYGLQTITNPSFEADAAGASPTGWIESGTNPDQEVSADFGHVVGATTLDSLMSLRQNVANSTAGNYSLVRQRVQPTELAKALILNESEFAVSAMIRFGGPLAKRNASVTIEQFSGGTSAVGSGTPLAAPSVRSFQTGCGPNWFMLLAAQRLSATVEYIDIGLRYEIDVSDDFDAGAHAYWDRIIAGGLIDFPKGFREFDLDGDAGYSVNQGDGVLEVVKLHVARSGIDVVIANVLEGSDFGSELNAYFQSVGGGLPGRCALWGDRDRFTNSERHFQNLVVDPSQPSIEYPAGVTRRTFNLKFLAPSEYVV